jgi:hypothetical protein
MLVLRYKDGDEELEEIDFIDLQSGTEGGSVQQQQEKAFKMKGGHKVPVGEAQTGEAILVVDLNAHHLSIRMLKNRSYIT